LNHNQPSLFPHFDTAEEAFNAFEEGRHGGGSGWLTKAKAVARQICIEFGRANIDQVRERCPPPADIDGRIMGAVFRKPMFRASGHVKSTRKDCHHRPICWFVLAGPAT